MPSQEQIAQKATRRAQRKALREANVEKAHSQERELTAAVASGEAKAKAKPPAAARKSHKEQVAEQRKAAEAKAAEQERMPVQPFVADPTPYRHSRENVPLHVLNSMARQVNEPLRQKARDIANAAGKAAFDAASGKRQPVTDPHRRATRMRDAQDAMAKQKAAQGDGEK